MSQSLLRFHIKLSFAVCILSSLILVNLNTQLFYSKTKSFLKEIHYRRTLSTDLEYYNTMGKNDNGRRLSSSFLSEYPDQSPVIVTYVSNDVKVVDELCLAFKTMVYLGDDDSEHPAPLLVFNEDDITVEQKEFIVGCTESPIAFPIVDLNSFPGSWINKQTMSTSFGLEGREQWLSHQLTRFWITGVWKHPAIEPFGTIMRLNPDSCFRGYNEYLPNFKYPNLKYHAQYVGVEAERNRTTGLIEAAEKYLESINRNPGDPLMWEFVSSTWETHHSLPVFRTSFELSSKKFMQRDDVAGWHETLTEQAPFGIYKYGWNEGLARFLGMAMFAKFHEISIKGADAYHHGQKCPKEEIENELFIYLQKVKE